ncbi:MAG TPA: hypothetical protein PLO37_20505 [Candidatus Hydrogenedentes bacterium]|nr:hypothetical protein [Candidatus Hydrogenedentota bacterium]HPG69236.1 hypothetical protein [Candidatus Hydrogenedentota bacterium]
MKNAILIIGVLWFVPHGAAMAQGPAELRPEPERIVSPTTAPDAELEPPPKLKPPTSAAEGPDAVLAELRALRAEVAWLQFTLDQLAEEFGVLPKGSVEGAPPPEPPSREDPAKPKPIPSQPLGARTDVDVPCQVVAEWGRMPEDAAKLGPQVASLKGMVCVVSEDIGADALVALGKQLRESFDSYDNINIDVFDDLNAAHTFANTNADEGGHRVLTVAKHPRTGYDMIIVRQNGQVTEIPAGR